MLSNYPPGVTGNEPQIAGYPESEIQVECDGIFYDDDDNESPCDFSGQVTLVHDGLTGDWDCPKCETNHTVDLEAEYGPDPDAAWDSRFDYDD